METQIEFTINWIEVAKFIGYVLLGVIGAFGFILFLFRNFRVF
jgi:hypothetical protein